MSNETVTYSLEAVLTRIEGKIDNLQKDVNQKFETLQKDFNQKFDSFQKDVDQKFDKIDERLNKLEVGQAKLTEKVEGIDNRLKSVEGTQKNQVWTLIILLTVSSFVIPEKRSSQTTSNWFSLKIVPDREPRKYI